MLNNSNFKICNTSTGPSVDLTAAANTVLVELQFLVQLPNAQQSIKNKEMSKLCNLEPLQEKNSKPHALLCSMTSCNTCYEIYHASSQIVSDLACKWSVQIAYAVAAQNYNCRAFESTKTCTSSIPTSLVAKIAPIDSSFCF